MRIIAKAQQDLHNGRAGGREADVEQARVRQPGHGERHGDTDAERAQNALRHDKDCLAEAGEIADKAE